MKTIKKMRSSLDNLGLDFTLLSWLQSTLLWKPVLPQATKLGYGKARGMAHTLSTKEANLRVGQGSN